MRTTTSDLEVLQVGGAKEAMAALSGIEPTLMVIDPSIAGEAREALLHHAESMGASVIAARAGVQIPGATMQEIEKYAILETLKSVGGSTSKAAKVLGISVRKIQYRLRDWRLRPAEVVAVRDGPVPQTRH